MNDTYAVVNKPKHPQPPPGNPAHFGEAPPRSSRTLPSSHHYDNDDTPSSAFPIYSCVRERKPHSLPPAATPIYDVAMPTSHRLGEDLVSHQSNVATDEQHSPTDDEYEDFSSSVTDPSGLCSPGSIGFNCRIQKPKGPRDPPSEWSRLER